MICLLLIMTMILITNAARAEQKIRHSDTLLKEEDMNARTKAWLLMVESGKVDQEEFRRITPKSIFIAPLLTSRTGKCQEGYRHNHLGQCVKVIKIDPKVQLELLLQRLNKLYGEKKEDKEEKQQEEEKTEFIEVSSGPLHFSLPISNVDEKINKTNNYTKSEVQRVSTINFTTPKVENLPEFMPIPLPIVYVNQTYQTKEIESSGAEPIKECEQYATISQLEGSGEGQTASGEGQTASGDGIQEEETTTESPVSLLFEETDYFDVTESELSTITEFQSTTDAPMEEVTTTKESLRVVIKEESYQNTTSTLSVNDNTEVLPKKSIHVQKETSVKNNPNLDKIHFPSDDDDNDNDNYNDDLRTPIISSSFESSRIRFPDEVSQSQTLIPSYHSQLDSSPKSKKYQSHSSAIPREQFWWLPKNWQIDENQHRSTLMKVWSRLPLMQDIIYSREISDDVKHSEFSNQPHSQNYSPQYRHEEFSDDPNQPRTPPIKTVQPFKNSRFQDVITTPRQNFRFER